MELFRKAFVMETNPADQDWTREHGFAETSQFPFPDIYLHEKVSALAARDGDLVPFLEDCLRRFVNHDYGNIISMDQVENFLSREINKVNTWMQGIWQSEKWGLVHLEIFYDMALFHLGEVPPRALALEQRAKERAEK